MPAKTRQHRDDIVRRDEMISHLQTQIRLRANEPQKREGEQAICLVRIKQMKDSLVAAQHAHATLEVLKKENTMLKDTITRLSFKMDEIRAIAKPSLTTSGIARAKGTVISGKEGDNTVRNVTNRKKEVR